MKAFMLSMSQYLGPKALHSELLTKLSSQFLSPNEFFAIFEVQVKHHFL